MAEEEEAPVEEPKEPEGEKPSEPISEKRDILNEAVQIHDLLSKDMKELKPILERLERAKATDMLGGRSDAGTEVKPKTDEEKTAEEAKAIVDIFH